MFGTEPARLWGVIMPSFLPGIPTCLGCSNSKTLTGDLTACQEILTYLLSSCSLSVECAFWLPEEEIMSVRTRLESDARFESQIGFACYIHHNICEIKKGRLGDTHSAAAGISKSLPCRKFQLSLSHKIHCCVFTTSVVWFPSCLILSAFSFSFSLLFSFYLQSVKGKDENSFLYFH